MDKNEKASENSEDLDSFLEIECAIQKEVLKEDAFNFDDIAFDTVIGLDKNDDSKEIVNQRAKLNLLNVINNRKVDQNSDMISLERS